MNKLNYLIHKIMEFDELINKVLPVMTEEEQQKMLKEVVEIANEESRLEAIADPLAISNN